MARPDDGKVADLLSRFVPVRVVQMRGVDLSLFDFDFDMTLAVVFLNADGTVYGRYGTRSAPRDRAAEDVSLEGLREAMEGVLELHAGYPGNRASLEGKAPGKAAVPAPERFPVFRGRFKEDLPRGCIHCHHVYQGERALVRAERRPLPDELLFPWPMPDTVGLELEVGRRATVKAVAPGSAAAAAGFRKGDRVLTLEGQPLVSVADFQWVLHNAPAEADLRATVERADGKRADLELPLAPGWRVADISWRESSWSSRPGFRCDPLEEAEKGRLGLEPGALALRVRFIFKGQDSGRAARKAGLEVGDVLVEVDGRKGAMTETDFLRHVQQAKVPGQTLAVIVLREGKRIPLRLPVPPPP